MRARTAWTTAKGRVDEADWERRFDLEDRLGPDLDSAEKAIVAVRAEMDKLQELLARQELAARQLDLGIVDLKEAITREQKRDKNDDDLQNMAKFLKKGLDTMRARALEIKTVPQQLDCPIDRVEGSMKEVHKLQLRVRKGLFVEDGEGDF